MNAADEFSNALASLSDDPGRAHVTLYALDGHHLGAGEAYSALFNEAVGDDDRVSHPPAQVEVRAGTTRWNVLVDGATWGGPLSLIFDDGSVAQLEMPGG